MQNMDQGRVWEAQRVREVLRVSTVAYIPLLLLAAGCSPDASGKKTGESGEIASSEVALVDPIPRIDVHTHVGPRAAAGAIALLEEQGIAVALNASGGSPQGGLSLSRRIAQASDGRLLPLCNLNLARIAQPGFANYGEAALEACRRLGAKGWKIHKYLGLGLTDARGTLVPVDDPRLDPLFAAAGRLGLPVLIHSGDPKAFFVPIDANNERLAELRIHPGWSFHGLSPSGEAWPSWNSLLEQLDRRIGRHPETVFVGAHFGNAAEEPQRVARMLRAHPNYVIDTAARVPEFGRHDATGMAAFFREFQDRILFGSDVGVGAGGLTLGSGDGQPKSAEDARSFFDAHWRYFETSARDMAHPTPIQGDWKVHGIGLSRPVLEKLYWRNAARVFSIDFSRFSGQEASD